MLVRIVRVDQQRLLAIIQESIKDLAPYRGPLPVKFDPAKIHSADLEANVSQLTNALSEPITVIYKKKSWTLQPADLGQFLVTTPAASGEGYDLSLDDVALGQFMLEAMRDLLGSPERRREMGEAGRRAVTQFTPDRVAGRLLEAVRLVREGRRSR